MDNAYFDTLVVFTMPVMGGRITLRGDTEERCVTSLGGPKGAAFAEMWVPYSQCVIAVVAGCFPPDLGREYEDGCFYIEVCKGFLSVMTRAYIRQVPVPTGQYELKGRLYQKHLEGNPDLVFLLIRKDGIPLALLTGGKR